MKKTKAEPLLRQGDIVQIVNLGAYRAPYGSVVVCLVDTPKDKPDFPCVPFDGNRPLTGKEEVFYVPLMLRSTRINWGAVEESIVESKAFMTLRRFAKNFLRQRNQQAMAA